MNPNATLAILADNLFRWYFRTQRAKDRHVELTARVAFQILDMAPPSSLDADADAHPSHSVLGGTMTRYPRLVFKGVLYKAAFSLNAFRTLAFAPRAEMTDQRAIQVRADNIGCLACSNLIPEHVGTDRACTSNSSL